MFDLVIVGGGVAGLCAALGAPPGARIAVIDKGEDASGSSPLAQGGIAAAVGADDSPERHARDTLEAGAGLCEEDVVHDVCAEGPRAIERLLALGCRFDVDADGGLHLAREGGQSVARSVHARDATGAEIVRTLRAAVRDRAVTRVRARATRLVVADGRCVGVETSAGPFNGGAVLLATGGAGALWAATTNAPGATGDGIALAADAGAQLADLEMMQFHPTALATPARQRPLLTEALRGHGAFLVDERGERFVDELAPRHVVTAAILSRGRAFLDCRHIARFAELFPTVAAAAAAHGYDAAVDLLPVEPAAHYFIGGVATDARGRTSIPGLFAAGECASTGMHGANRMAGNSLLEAVVVGDRVGVRVGEPPPDDAGAGRPPQPTAHAHAAGTDAAASVEERFDDEIPRIMQQGVGPVRDEDGLHEAVRALLDRPASAYRDLCLMIARAASARLESRGVHIRRDFPSSDPIYRARSYDRRPQRVG